MEPVVELSTHCRERCHERGITEKAVKTALRTPFASGFARSGAYWSVAPAICDTIRRWVLVIWTDKPDGTVEAITTWVPRRLPAPIAA